MSESKATRSAKGGASSGARSRGRELALKYLYQLDVRKGPDGVDFDMFAEGQEETGTVVTFARDLVKGVLGRQAELDGRIQALAKNWSLARMAVIDRNVLRIGAFELLDPAMPASIAINEAVELAKRFSTAQSGKFVNGILDKLRSAAPELPAP